MKETFGQYVRTLRQQKGLTLTQLGALLLVDSAALSKIETGKKSLDDKLLPTLATIFDLNIDEVKNEYYSEMIANLLYDKHCSSKVLTLAEEKVKYRRNKTAMQTKLNLNDDLYS